MASAANRVIAGDYSGKYIKYGLLDSRVIIQKVSSCDCWVSSKLRDNPNLKEVKLNSFGELEITKNNITNYEVITEEKMKSGTSAIMRGALGAAVLGPIGILAGLTAKTKGIHTVAIEWVNGKKSLIEVDDKIYKKLLSDLF